MTVLKLYPSYRDSGLPSLGDVPATWTIARNKQILREVDRRSQTGGEQLLSVSQYRGVSARVASGSEVLTRASSLEGYKLVSCGDLVVNIMVAWNGSLGISQLSGITSPAYGVYRPNSAVVGRYIHYLYRTPQYLEMIKAVSTGVVDSRLRLYSDALFALPVLLPPLDEQRAIADFLDVMDARISHYIAAKRRMIALLEEQKQAIINQAVTRGLDTDVPLKPSGVDWLGDIPAHWEVLALRQLVTVHGGMTPTKARTDYWSGSVPWVSPKDMKTFELFSALDTISDAAVRETGLMLLPVGTVLIVVRGMILARRVPIAVTRVPLTINQDMKGLVTNERVRSDFLARTLSASQDAFTTLIDEAGHGTRRLPTPRLMSLSIPVPPIDEQAVIEAYLLKADGLVENAVRRATRETSLVLEYRTRLISDVVTGKLDVRGVELPAVEEYVDAGIEDAVDGSGVGFEDGFEAQDQEAPL